MISFHFSPVRLLVAIAGLAALALSNSCASHQRVVRVVSHTPHFTAKEICVTGRAVVHKSGSEWPLEVVGFKQPDGATCAIAHQSPGAELQRKLDPQKPYRFHVFITDQTRSDDSHSYHAALIKVEDADHCIIDESICRVHHGKMEMVQAQSQSWDLKSSKEQRDMELYRNHGYCFPSCCSGGMNIWYTWRCSECTKKVDAFKTKYVPQV